MCLGNIWRLLGQNWCWSPLGLKGLKPMAWVSCGISLQKEMPPYSHVQQLNNCKQPYLESPCPKLSSRTIVYVCKISPPPPGGVSLAGPRTNCYEPLFVSLSLLNHVICKNWHGAISKKTIGDEFSWNSQQPPAPIKNPEKTMFSQFVKRSPCMVALQNSAYWSASPVKSRSHDYLRTHKGC